MGKVKLDDKSGKSADVFFDDENHAENEALNFAGGATLSEIEDKDSMGESKSFINVLKQLFLFLPGTFLLFFMSFAAAMIAVEIILFRRATETLPDDYLLQFALIGFVMLLGTLMTWLGLGDIKNKKHFAIPVSIILTGITTGAILRVAAKISDFADRILDDFDYLIFLFPLALIVPVLAKGIVDRKSEDV